MTRYILTGGPGAGKTTLLGALASLGYATVEESARAIIAERLAAGMTPRPQAAQFAREILRRDIEKYERTKGLLGPVIFDRGTVEALGLVQQNERWSKVELERMLIAYPFDRPVFILTPWPAIYTVDTERDQTFQDAIGVYEEIVAWYSQCGYPLYEVPHLPVEGRAQFVHQVISNTMPD